MQTQSTEHLNWRYATKNFDPAKFVSQTDLNHLLESLRLAPSSFGLQPWKFVVIQDRKLRETLKPYAWNQSQVADASHLIVLCRLKKMDAAYVDNYIDQISQAREVSTESLSAYRQMMLGFLEKYSEAESAHWMMRQVYLALGVLLSECAARKIDACPMEGFEPEKFDEILKLEEQGLVSAVLCPVGYRTFDDKYASLKKVRFESHQVILHL